MSPTSSPPPDQPFFECELPIDSAIAAFSEEFKQIEREIDQVLTGTPKKAKGSFGFCPGQNPPYDWGAPPVQNVTVTPDGVVTVSPITLNPNKYIKVGGVKIVPYIDFFPQDPKSGAFGRLETNKHFSSRKQLIGQFEIIKETRTFHFSTYAGFTAADVGRWLYNPFAAHPGNIGFFQITEVTDSQRVVCGAADNLDDEYALSYCDLVTRDFKPDDQLHQRLLNISGTGSNDGQYRILTYVSNYEVILDMPSTPSHFDGDMTWSVSYTMGELQSMIILSRPFMYHPQVYFSVLGNDMPIEARLPGPEGNVVIDIGSELPFLCQSGSTLTGGKNGSLSEDKDDAEASINDVFDTTNTILSLGGTNSEEVTTSQNAIPPKLSPTELRRRVGLCGFPTVGDIPITKGQPRMAGYSTLFELCGFDILRNFLRNGKPGDRYVVSLALIPSFESSPASCGTNNLDVLTETPMCGVYPKDAPEAIMYYVFHHTAPAISSSAISTLLSQGFTMEQISVLMMPKGAMEENVTSVVLSYTTAIEEALQVGFTVDDIISVLSRGIEDWKYDASNSELLQEINKVRRGATTSTARSCFVNYWKTLDETKLSSGAGSLSVCEITDLSLRKAVEFVLKQNDKISKMMSKVKDVTASLGSALSLNDFVNTNLANFPNDTLRCLIGGVQIPQVGVSLDPNIGGAVANFGNTINPKINLAGAQAKALLGRAGEVLGLASKSVCLLQKTVNSMLGESLGCLAPNVSPNLPQCALDLLQHTFDMLDSLSANIDLSLALAATLETSMSSLANLNILSTDPATGAAPSSQASCDDDVATSFLGSIGINTRVF